MNGTQRYKSLRKAPARKVTDVFDKMAASSIKDLGLSKSRSAAVQKQSEPVKLTFWQRVRRIAWLMYHNYRTTPRMR